MTHEEAEQLLTTIAQSRIPNIKAEAFNMQDGYQIRIHHIIVDPRETWLWWVKSPAEWAKLCMRDLRNRR